MALRNREDALIGAACCVVLCEEENRRFWVRPTLKARKKYSGSDLLEDFQRDDEDLSAGELRTDGSFKNFLRMTSQDFEYLLQVIGPRIGKKTTPFRDAISAKERLAVTLRFFSTGDSFASLAVLFKISKSTISLIVPEVCDALIDALQCYVRVTCNPEEWLMVAEDFEKKWNFPNCVGSVDGKHVTLQAPFASGSKYFNCKEFFSVVLMAVVDANYCFTYVNVGCQGRLSDGGVFANCQFKKKLDSSQLNLPATRDLPGRNSLTPYVFVADDAFPLLPNIMKPYSGIHDKGL